VDLLPAALADVGHVEVSGQLVEGGTPGIAETVSPDLVTASSGPVHERIRRRDAVDPSRRAAVGRRRVGIDPAHVDAQDLAEERRLVLSVPPGPGHMAAPT